MGRNRRRGGLHRREGIQMNGYFKLEEFIQSEKATELGIDNTPPEDIKNTLLLTMASMERVRSALGFPIIVHSGYRCDELNKAVGGSPKSQHMKGEACDFICPGLGTPAIIATFLLPRMAEFGIDQMIMEGTWVHLSFTATPRKQVLTMKDGKYFGGLLKT